MRRDLETRLSALEQKIAPQRVYFFGYLELYPDKQCVGITNHYKNLMRKPNETLEELEARAHVELELPRDRPPVICFWLYEGEVPPRFEYDVVGEPGRWPEVPSA